MACSPLAPPPGVNGLPRTYADLVTRNLGGRTLGGRAAFCCLTLAVLTSTPRQLVVKLAAAEATICCRAVALALTFPDE
jgi:hypothetical protein